MDRDLSQQGRMASAAEEEPAAPAVHNCTSFTSPAATSAASPSPTAMTSASSPSPTEKPCKRRRENEGLLRSPRDYGSTDGAQQHKRRREDEETLSPRDRSSDQQRNAAGQQQQAMAPPRSFEDDADEEAVFRIHMTRGGVRGLVESGAAFVPAQFVAPVPPVSSAAGTAFAAPSVDLSLPLVRHLRGHQPRRPCRRDRRRARRLQRAALRGIPENSGRNCEPWRSPHYSPAPIGATTYATVPILRPRGVTPATATTPILCWRDSLIVRFDCAWDPELRSIPAPCQDALIQYQRSMARLGRELAGLLLEGLGVEAGRLGKTQGCLMQCHYHPPCPEPERVLGSRKHADADLFTVLAQDEVGGLQVRLDDGDGEWMDVAPVPGALKVNVGDLLKVLSNHEYKSVEHRVVIKSAEEPRVSIALFFNPVNHGESDFFSPFPELVTAEKPAQYRTLTWLEMLANRVELGHAKPSSLDEFRVTSN
ncbi:unnamed protein product [Urochloa decumbens]|uniref:Fe2OG dioxygenase domain-containing protein n=1 Tax=Urochloa decumbens TaxID=240449 RepID=A0ABC8YTR5_9POAL